MILNKILFSFLILTFSVNTFAAVKRNAVIRDKNFNAKIEEVSLENLTNNEAYEGKFFKIVEGKSNTAVSMNASEALQLKAATTYYHLSKARDFFVNQVKSEYVTNLPQVIIRLNLTNVFNEIGHFAHDNLDPQFNNALSIPEGVGYPARNISPWGLEIWFRPSKEINIKDYPELAGDPNIKASLSRFRNQAHMDNLENFMYQLFASASGYQIDPRNVMRTAGSSILIELVYQTSDIAADFFSQKIYRLDTALIPEIIYHEFSHIALSNSLELTHSTPVNEGMADFFAGKIANSKKLATKIKDYNLYSGKEVQRKQQYQMAYERGELANTDFVFGLLWMIGETVGENEIQFMNTLSGKIDTNSNIRDDLVNATLETCSTNCADPFVDRLKLYRFFNKKNL
jgi:hypothetical protein